MTTFVLLQNVAYEGSSLKGIFPSLESTLDHIDSMEGWCLDGWTCDRARLVPISGWELERVHGAVAGWLVSGPADLSWTVFSFEGAAQ